MNNNGKIEKREIDNTLEGIEFLLQNLNTWIQYFNLSKPYDFPINYFLNHLDDAEIKDVNDDYQMIRSNFKISNQTDYTYPSNSDLGNDQLKYLRISISCIIRFRLID